jgi:starch synthase
MEPAVERLPDAARPVTVVPQRREFDERPALVPSMRVLLACSEAGTLAKTGGLADVCAALPRALGRLGADMRVILPAYDSALEAVESPVIAADLGEVIGVSPVRLLSARAGRDGFRVLLVDCPALYRRPGTPYQAPDGSDWPDNALRFGVFCHAVARVATGAAGPGWRPDIVHCHDWHTGLVPYLVARTGAVRPRTLFTIHNAAFQGNFPLAEAGRLGLPADALAPENLEFYGQLSFLKAGIRHADRLTTVSPNYARELCMPRFGFGLEGLIASRARDFTGILNGIDTELWNPQTDRVIAERFSRDDPEGKAACKAELQRACGLTVDPGAPLVSCASRLTWQKMADVVLAFLPRLLQRHPRLQFVLVGRGERAIEAGFAELGGRFPRRVGVHIGYTEERERRLHAGADILLHGSRFEPCGLAPMYAMRYGGIPVVSRVGGLIDTVADERNGFVFDGGSPDALESGLERCLDAYGAGPRRWQPLRRQAMAADFGWTRSARAYLACYAGDGPPQASSTARMPARKMPSKVPAPPMEAIGAPVLRRSFRRSKSAPITTPSVPPT